jgi:hypothetical protein
MSAKRAPPRNSGNTGYVPRNPTPTPSANVVVTTRVSRRPRTI